MIGVQASEHTCDPCNKDVFPSPGKKNAGLITGILLALLPKCPFCFMAFSGTVVLCGNGSVMYTRTFSSTTTVVLTVLFCLATLMSIVLNFRDSRTVYATILALAGSLMIVWSVTSGGGLELYYFGVFLVFMGVWLNASLLYFLRKIKLYRHS